jgi:hypothetical protein
MTMVLVASLSNVASGAKAPSYAILNVGAKAPTPKEKTRRARFKKRATTALQLFLLVDDVAEVHGFALDAAGFVDNALE